MRALVLWAALLAASGACGAIPQRRRPVVMTAAAVVVIAGETAGAYALHTPTASAVGLEVTAGAVAGLLPAAILDGLLHDHASPDATPSAYFDGLLRGLAYGGLASLATLVPAFATWGAGEWHEGRPESRGWGFNGALLFAGGGLLLSGSMFHDAHLPRWARLALSAAMVGAGAAFGYQLGGGGPRPP